MNRRKIIGALTAAILFAILMLLLDWNLDPENFGKSNYLLKLFLLGIPMFFIYLLPEHIKNITWKELFNRQKKY